MPHDARLVSEAHALKRDLDRFQTLAALDASPDGAALRARVAAVLATVRRHEPQAPPAAPRDPSCVRAVHWNIEHGNWYEQVERALVSHPALAGADLVLLNEIDLGMARAGNRDVTADLALALGMHGAWVPQFLETTIGRDDDASTAGGRANEESLFGLAVLSRWPIERVRVVELPSPDRLIFDTERMLGRFVALVADVARPGAPFVAVAAHLEVHRTRAHRAAQIRTVVHALRDERRPVILAGDWNTHTFDRGLWHSPLSGGSSLLTWPGPLLRRRFLHPDRGPFREPLFAELRAAGFEWKRFVDFAPTLQLRLERLEEVMRLPAWLRSATAPVRDWAEARGALRLDWFAARGFAGGHAATVRGLDGRGLASDHAPIVAEFATPGPE